MQATVTGTPHKHYSPCTQCAAMGMRSILRSLISALLYSNRAALQLYHIELLYSYIIQSCSIAILYRAALQLYHIELFYSYIIQSCSITISYRAALQLDHIELFYSYIIQSCSIATSYRAVLQLYYRAVLQLCYRAVQQLCYRAALQLCYRAVLQLHQISIQYLLLQYTWYTEIAQPCYRGKQLLRLIQCSAAQHSAVYSVQLVRACVCAG